MEDVRHDMGGCDKVDIMAANLLKFEHHVCQFFIFTFVPSSLMRDGPVLAKDTAEVAVGEEDRSGPIMAYQRDLLTKMGVSAENDEFHRSPAETSFTFFSIHTTAPGTELAILEDSISLLDSLGKFPLLLQLLISRDPWFFLFWGSMGGNRREE
jgi:hypothetical protein